GIAGLHWLASLEIPAVAIDYRSARIGDGADMLAGGIVSMANEVAAQHGCLPGHSCTQAVRCLTENSEAVEADPIPDIGEARKRIGNTGHREVWAVDSVSLAAAEDRRKVLVTGSHGALLGGAADDGVLDV